MDSSPEPSVSPSMRRYSSYTLKTIDDERASLLKNGDAPQPSYGAVPVDDPPPLSSAETRRKLLFAGIKMAILFVVSSVLLFAVLKLALPTLDEYVGPLLFYPRSLNVLTTGRIDSFFMYPGRLNNCNSSIRCSRSTGRFTHSG